MSQNPMKLDQQVPRHIWESHGRGFWMLSSPNMESGRPKLALLVFKDKRRTKTLTKPEKCSHASPCSEVSRAEPGLPLWVVIWDELRYSWIASDPVGLSGFIFPPL